MEKETERKEVVFLVECDDCRYRVEHHSISMDFEMVNRVMRDAIRDMNSHYLSTGHDVDVTAMR